MVTIALKKQTRNPATLAEVLKYCLPIAAIEKPILER
jgi:hypothetical protein